MKLRNKKTGEIKTIRFPSYEWEVDDDKQYTLNIFDYEGNEYNYNTLAELNADWEDYKPAEPLIKDEKIRKVVRAWAEVNATPEVQYDRYGDCICLPYSSDRTGTTISISFDDIHALKELKHLQTYTIAELCGEDDE